MQDQVLEEKIDLDLNAVKKEEVMLAILSAPNSIFSKCSECGKLFYAGGLVAIAIIGDHKLIVGQNPPVIHCEKDRQVPLYFWSEDEAVKTVQNIRAWFMSDDGTVEGLSLHATYRHIIESDAYRIIEVPG